MVASRVKVRYSTLKVRYGTETFVTATVYVYMAIILASRKEKQVHTLHRSLGVQKYIAALVIGRGVDP